MTITKIQAIQSLAPKAEVVVGAGDVVTWHNLNGETQPTEEQITAEINRLETQYTNDKYKRDRAAEFPSYGEQLDYIYHHGVAKWKTDIVQPVKDKYPKGGS
tara:strand:+ start:447 stop:752 length:306 start_codon:yes stop_codon:yes gene_type:complete